MLRNNPILSDIALFMIVFLTIVILLIILGAVIYHLISGNGPKDYAPKYHSSRDYDCVSNMSRNAYLHGEMEDLKSSIEANSWGHYTPDINGGINEIGRSLGETGSVLGDFAADVGKGLVNGVLGK